MQKFLKDSAHTVSVSCGCMVSWKLGTCLAYFGEVAPFITGSLFKYVAQ